MTYRTLDDIEMEYLRTHPEEVDAYVKEIFNAYAEDNDAAALCASLRVIAKVKGVSTLAQNAGISRQGVQKALSSKGNPRLDTITAVLQGMGYRLQVTPIEPRRQA
jgi:probable addiction module antidote protein